MKTRGRIWAALFLALVIGFAWYQSIARTPDGQPPLVTVDAASLEALRADFNRDANRVRMIVLLAPT